MIGGPVKAAGHKVVKRSRSQDVLACVRDCRAGLVAALVVVGVESIGLALALAIAVVFYVVTPLDS